MDSQVLAANAQNDLSIDAEPRKVEQVLFQERFDSAHVSNNWVPLSGEWISHNGALVQRRSDPYGHSIILKTKKFDEYILRANIRHMKGIGGGLLFNVQDERSKKRTHVVQFSQSGNGIFWGYFDAQGNFVGQGYERTTPIQDELHLIEISVGEDAYTIALDGYPVASDVPLQYRGGKIGCFSSKSVVAFDAVQIRTPDAPPESLALHPAAHIQDTPTPSSTDWVHTNGIIEHRSKTTRESILSFLTNESLPSHYTLRAQITLPIETELSQAAGGLIFHMPAKNHSANAQSVRIANAGRDVIWGQYDSNGVFQRTGVRILNLDPLASHTLLLRVHDDFYDIFVDGQEVVRDVPALAHKGWIGFLGVQGPVSFSSFHFSPATDNSATL